MTISKESLLRFAEGALRLVAPTLLSPEGRVKYEVRKAAKHFISTCSECKSNSVSKHISKYPRIQITRHSCDSCGAYSEITEMV